jgi:hypothetical protein
MILLCRMGTARGMGSIPQYARLFGEFCHKPLTPKKNRAPVSQGAVHD